MPKSTKDEQSNIKKILQYIKLDLDKVPEFLKRTMELDYRPLKSYEENGYKVYKYISIRDIQIMLTPKNRLNSIQEKYGLASPIYEYLIPDKEDNIIKYTTFLKMLTEVSTEEIEEVEKEQQELNRQIPFKVKYHDNYLWQIYYSDITDTYFMLVPTEDLEYSMFFYLLKKQIELNKQDADEMIFVPISHEGYSHTYLKKSEFNDMEKYIWYFTKEWPLIYEVYDKQENLSIQIVGQTSCYEKIKSSYKIVLESKEQTNKFYQLLKALFILQTELPHQYEFTTKITKCGGLEFELEHEKVEYDTLPQFLNKEYQKARNSIQENEIKNQELKEKLEQLKQIATTQEGEYLQKEKQIATYLECRRTFFGKVKYFFKKRKKNKHKEQAEEVIEEKETLVVSTEELKENTPIENPNKDYYTIEDILKINQQLEILLTEVKNTTLDVQALEDKNAHMELKIKNATLYIDEIDSHEKSIFEFWKFANKDENLLLNQGVEQEEDNKLKLEKVFDYEEDIQEIGNQVDKIQRKLFNKQETDAIYLASTMIRKVWNKECPIEEALQMLKQEAEEQRILFQKESFDIFGGIREDGTKIKNLGNQKHRESQKEKLKLLEIHKDTTVEELQEKITTYLEVLQNSINKAKSPISIPVYYATNKKKEEFTGLEMFDIRPEEALKQVENADTIYLYRLDVKEEIPIIYFSNSMYFDNVNKTLPMGMDIDTRCLIDLEKVYITLKTHTNFRINEEIEENIVKNRNVQVYEYEIEVKKGND